MKISAAERVARFYGCFSSEDRVLILINADPDAIASAMAVKRLLWRRVACACISSINVIERPDNIAMVRLMGLTLMHVDDLDPDRFSRTIIVDSQQSHSERFAPFEPTVVIDHHPDRGGNPELADIRPKYGATATILTEYLRAAKIKPSAKLASGLFYAIKTDTANFTRQTLIEDVRAFQFLFRNANMHLVRKIEQSDLKPVFLKYFKRAVESRRKRKNKMFVYLNRVVNPDVCVLIADFFMRVADINWSIVAGIYEDKLIVVFRNDGVRKHAGNVASESFGSMGSAGGHKTMARAEVALCDIDEKIVRSDPKRFLQWLIPKIEKRAGKS